MTKAIDLKTKSDDELKDQLMGLKKEAFNLRFQQASGALENTAQVSAAPSPRRPDKEVAKDAETYSAGRRRQRQDGQDRDRSG